MMNWKDFERKWLRPNCKLLSRNWPGETYENHEEPQGSRSTGRDLNLGPSG
jgi:hypothetical protein